MGNMVKLDAYVWRTRLAPLEKGHFLMSNLRAKEDACFRFDGYIVASF